MTDTSIQFEQSLDYLLSRLGKMSWAQPFKLLEEKLRQIPVEECSFAVELINMLHQLNEAFSADVDTPLPQMAAIRIASFECWTFRFFKETPEGRRYLDPLTSTASDFCDAISIQQSSSQFPAPDIIKRWAREHLQ